VTLAITDLNVGGAERALVALATGLDRRRWLPTVVCLDAPGPLADPLVAAEIETVCLGVNPRRPVQAVRRLASVLRRWNPRLIQSFLFHANIAARLASPFAGRPWVIGGIRVAERRRRWHLTLDRLTSRLSTGAVCVSDGVFRFTSEQGRIDSDRLTVIPNGVDPRPFDRASPADRLAMGIASDAVVALFVGRLDPQKGVSSLLEAAARVETSGRAWHLVIVGDGPERDRLRGLARSLPRLDESVRWLGRRDDVPSLMKAADLLILPSLWEGMPNVVLEAMAARRAVIATAVEGSEDLVVPGQTGWLVPPGEPRRLTEALQQAIFDPALRRSMGQAGRARVEAHFTLSRVVEAYERLWAGVLGYELP